MECHLCMRCCRLAGQKQRYVRFAAMSFVCLAWPKAHVSLGGLQGEPGVSNTTQHCCMLLNSLARCDHAAKSQGRDLITCEFAGTVGQGQLSVECSAEFTPWLEWELKWGTQLAPQLQQWFKRAEHPTGSTAFKRALCYCCIPQ